MRYIVVTLALTFALHQAALFTVALAQAPASAAFEEMAEAERAFVRRAQEVGAAPAFIQFFAEDAVGFQSGQAASAQAELKKRPAPPRDPNVIFWWEPRYGDVAASGDLGWLTGPVRMGRKDRDDGKIRHGNYASIWKRQKDGSFRVVIDIGIEPPGEVPFAPGLVRAPFQNRYTASEIAPLNDASLMAADRALNAAAKASLVEAFAKVAAPAIRVHRNSHLPFEGRDAVLAWLKTQPPMSEAESLYAEAARSGDLGYTWGSYEKGHYARVWVRDAAGAWHLSLDLDAPKPPKP